MHKNAPEGSRPYQPPTERLVLTDLSLPDGDPLRERVASLNPTDFSVRAAAEYPTLDVPGLSHQVQQWSHTRSFEYRFQLRWSYIIESDRARHRGQQRIAEEHRDLDIWLERFMHPVARGVAPALLKVFWANFLGIVGNVLSVDVNYTQWSHDGAPMAFTVDLAVREHRRLFVSSQTFYARGGQTSLGSQG